MTDSTRRNFLKYAGAGAAAVGVAAVAPSAIARAEHSGAADTSIPGSTPSSFMAYVSDVHSGEVTMLLDGREVLVKDASLVAQLAKATTSKG